MEITMEPLIYVVGVGASNPSGILKLIQKLKDTDRFAPAHLATVSEVADRMSQIINLPQEERDNILILNFQHHGNEIQDVSIALQAASRVRIALINRWGAADRCGDRFQLKTSLKDIKMPIPDFFWGKPQDIPVEMGEQVVLKGNRDHLVVVIDRTRSRSCGESVYVEKLLDNPHAPFVRCVYVVCGEVFTATKIDDFVDRKLHPMLEELMKSKGIVDDDPVEVQIARRVAKKLRLDICSVEFIGGQIIDVNECPDFFFHEPAIDAVVEFVDDFMKSIRGKKKAKKK